MLDDLITDAKEINLRWVKVKRDIKIQAVFINPTNCITKNYPQDQFNDIIASISPHYKLITIETYNNNKEVINNANKKSVDEILEKLDTLVVPKEKENISSSTSSFNHDVEKKYLIDSNESFLFALGITNDRGKPTSK